MKFIFFYSSHLRSQKLQEFFFSFLVLKIFVLLRVGNLDFYVFDKRTLMFWM